MIGNYVLHYPITDFAVSLLVVAALVEVLARLLQRPQWRVAVDWLLSTGFAAAVAAVGTGLWLDAIHRHSSPDTVSLHRSFALSTLGVATISVAARVLERRIPKLSVLKTVALVIAAGLVCCTGYVGGKMTHGAPMGHVHTHEGDHEPADNSDEAPTPHDETPPHVESPAP